jgi:hypothetical protein
LHGHSVAAGRRGAYRRRLKLGSDDSYTTRFMRSTKAALGQKCW